MFNAHFSHIVKMGYFLFSAEIAAHFALLCRLYVLVWSEVIHDHGDLIFVKHAVLAKLCELLDSYGRGDIVAEDQI